MLAAFWFWLSVAGAAICPKGHALEVLAEAPQLWLVEVGEETGEYRWKARTLRTLRGPEIVFRRGRIWQSRRTTFQSPEPGEARVLVRTAIPRLRTSAYLWDCRIRASGDAVRDLLQERPWIERIPDDWYGHPDPAVLTLGMLRDGARADVSRIDPRQMAGEVAPIAQQLYLDQVERQLGAEAASEAAERMLDRGVWFALSRVDGAAPILEHFDALPPSLLLQYMGRMKDEGPHQGPLLQRYMRHPEPLIRASAGRWAVERLFVGGEPPPAVVAAALLALMDPVDEVRRTVETQLLWECCDGRITELPPALGEALDRFEALGDVHRSHWAAEVRATCGPTEWPPGLRDGLAEWRKARMEQMSQPRSP